MAKIFLLPRHKNVRKYLVFKVTYAGSSPSCDCALSSGLVLLTLGWERDGLDPVIEDQGLLKMEEADVVADGVGVIVGMANDLLQVPSPARPCARMRACERCHGTRRLAIAESHAWRE